MDSQKMVSIVVVTYNSSKYVVETLDSIKEQTSDNWELIISDDCSTDNTIDVCQQWIDRNRSFIRVKLVTVNKNMGISFNLNRGIKASRGKWIKLMAGDDLLRKDAIEKFLAFVFNRECDICLCNLQLFNEYNDVPHHYVEEYAKYFECVKQPRENQFKILAKSCPFTGPGYFFSRKLYDEINGFNEKYPMWEEYTFAYSVLTHGYQIYPLEEKIVLYRVRSDSASIGRGKNIMNPKMYHDCKNIFYDYQVLLLQKQHKYFTIWHLILFWAKEGAKIRYKNGIMSIILCSFFSVIDPSTYYSIIKKKYIQVCQFLETKSY